MFVSWTDQQTNRQTGPYIDRDTRAHLGSTSSRKRPERARLFENKAHKANDASSYVVEYLHDDMIYDVL